MSPLMPDADSEAIPGDPHINALAVVGPTAAGKTAIAELLALRIGGEIVSADSMQVYRDMDVGTAKPSVSSRLVPYHCLDLVEPGEPFSAALYQGASRTAIADIAARGRLPLVVGGTGLYVRAALDKLDFPPGEQLHNPRRDEYERYARREGAAALHALLRSRDPDSAALIHPNNTRRVVRALEMADEGLSYAQQSSGFARRESVYNTRFIGVTMERDALYDRIDARVDDMIGQGLVDEVRLLLARGFRAALTAAQAIGYKEFVPVIEHGADLDDAIEQVKRATRRYAKRQLTWFRADPRVRWIDVTYLSPTDAAEAILATLDWDETTT